MAKSKRSNRSKQGPKPPPKPIHSLWLAAGLVVVTLLVYANSLYGEFVFDDLPLIRNPGLQSVETLADAVSFQGFRSLTFMTYGLNVYFGGMNPFGFHLVNVLLHALNVVLLYLLLLHLSGQLRYPAAIGSLIFAVHPLFTEAVANVSGRYTLLCGTFYLVSVVAFIRGVDSDAIPRRVLWFLMTAVAGVLAWQAKQEALALPISLGALAWISSSKKRWGFLIPPALVLILIAAFYRDTLLTLIRSVAANTALVSSGADPALPVTDFFRTYLTAVVGYFGPRFILPMNLSADPYVSEVTSWFSPEFIFSISVLGGLSWLIFQGGKFNRWAMAGVVMLLVSPLTAYAFIPLADIILEHRVYIPGFGIAVLSGWLARAGLRRYGNVVMAGVAVVAGIFSVMTVQRNAVWRDPLTLWETTEADSPRSVRPHLNLGEEYQRVGRFAEAISEYEHVREIQPGLVAASSNLGVILMNLGQLDDAEKIFLDVTSRAPSFPEGWINRGQVHVLRGELSDALVYFQKAIDADPTSATALMNMGSVLSAMGQYEAAEANYRRAIALRPDAPQLRLDLATSLFMSGDRDGAEQELLSLDEDSLAAGGYMNLGRLATDDGDYPAALNYFSESARLRPSAEALNTVGSTYLAMDMPDLAIVEFQNALRIEPGYGPSSIQLAIAYERTGDVENACRTLREFLQFHETSPYAPQAREKLLEFC